MLLWLFNGYMDDYMKEMKASWRVRLWPTIVLLAEREKMLHRIVHECDRVCMRKLKVNVDKNKPREQMINFAMPYRITEERIRL